jgi:hypothetical protein
MWTGGNATATREANGKEAANEEHFGRPSGAVPGDCIGEKSSDWRSVSSMRGQLCFERLRGGACGEFSFGEGTNSQLNKACLRS